jgi:hypothetical protein
LGEREKITAKTKKAVYKVQKLWYNKSAKQTEYTVYGCIFF